MEYRSLGRAGVKVSQICLGTMMFGGPTNEEDSIRIIHRAIDAGINFLDTANVYNQGESERVVGKAMRSMRDEVVIATKVTGGMGDGVNQSGSSRYHIMMEVEASLKRLGTDRIDHIEVELLPFCRENGLGVVSYSPLARGVLAGKYLPGRPHPSGSRAARQDRRIYQTELRDESFEVAQELKPLAEVHGKTLTQFALAWVLANPIITSVIIGPRTMEQLKDNLGCLDCVLSQADEEAIDQLVSPGEHTGKGYNDPSYPVTGRPTGK
ncbi:aldo/keto reductase [Candidatus Poribacteria bacterium]|nr:aldo/keto reductase [Candidatus Poribacteria bacterium]